MPTRREFLLQSGFGLAAGAGLLGRWRWPAAPNHGTVSGMALDVAGRPLSGARITLVDQSRALVGEARTDQAGRYVLDVVAEGRLKLGASRPGYGYAEFELDVQPGEMVAAPLELGADDNPGRWTRIGDTSPEYLGATNSGTLLADGRILYCHDTEDPLIFDPVNGNKGVVLGSGSAQGCHATTVLLDGRVLFVGGQDGDDPGNFRNGIPWVKAYDPASNTWERLPDMNQARWYPTLTRLADGGLLVTGGGQPPDARRTDTGEVFDPDTQRWTPTGRMLNPAEFGPSVLLFTGEVLRGWYPPQLWNPQTGRWRATGDFVEPDRGYPGHSPHSLVLLPDGRAAAVGVPASAGPAPAMVELYDPVTGTWSKGASPETVRSYPEVLLLPDGKILAAGGQKEFPQQPGAPNAYGFVALADLYDPVADLWRPLAPMALGREYHALTILAPDGRVIVTAGTGAPAQSGAGTDNRVDAFEPPYLLRGPRPVIERLSRTDLTRGETVELGFSGTFAPTAVVLIGLNAVTHYVDGGAGRLVSVPFAQNGDTLVVTVPEDPVLLPVAHYILFLMVDDIPSEGRIVRVLPQPAPGPTATHSPTTPPPSTTPSPTTPPKRSIHLPWAQR